MRIGIVDAQIISEAVNLAKKGKTRFAVSNKPDPHKIDLYIEVIRQAPVKEGEFTLNEAMTNYQVAFEYLNEYKNTIDFVKAVKELDITYINDLDADTDTMEAFSRIVEEKQSDIVVLAGIIAMWDKFAFIQWVESREI